MTEPELKPIISPSLRSCAHCGSQATCIQSDWKDIHIECNKCWIRTATYIHEDYAIEAWNRREPR